MYKILPIIISLSLSLIGCDSPVKVEVNDTVPNSTAQNNKVISFFVLHKASL